MVNWKILWELVKDIIEDTGFCKVTVHKYLKWLEKRNLIRREGKKIFAVDYNFC